MQKIKIILIIFFLFIDSKKGFSACTLTATSVAFGSFNPFTLLTPRDVNGTLTITCTPPHNNITYTLALNAGGDGSINPNRHMLSGANTLNYNLYTTTGRTIIWGDGTNGTAVISANHVNCRKNPCPHTIFGRLFAPQTTARVGNYTATITATLTYN